MKLKVLTLLSCMMFACMGTQASDLFKLGITGYSTDGNNTPATTSVTLDGNYKFTFALPTPDAQKKVNVGADKALIEISDNLITGGGTASKTMTTNVSGITADLHAYLSNAYAFAGVKSLFTVKDATTTKTATYKYSACSNNTITATPVSTAEAKAAWELFQSKLEKASNSGDSFFGFKKGTYFRFGDEDLVFDADLDLLKGEWSIEGVYQDEEDAVHIAKNGLTGAETYKQMIFLPAGSVIAVGNKMATLTEDGTITIDGTAGYDSSLDDVTGAITAYRTAMGDNNTKLAIDEFMKFFNKAIGLIDYAEVAPVTIEFGKSTGNLTVYAGNSTKIENVSAYDFVNTYQKEAPNAIAIVTSDNASEVEGLTNAIVEYTVGKSGKYWECENFILTDKEDFYTPVNFTAIEGNYKRQPNSAKLSNVYYNSYCVPFDLKASDLSSTAKILTFSYYSNVDGDRNVYFNTVSSVDAGTPCMIYETGSKWNDIEFLNTVIYATPDNSNNMKGTYVATKDYSVDGYYAVNTNNKFGPLKNALQPFRSTLLLSEGTIIETAKPININIIDENEATAINAVSANNNNVESIYSVNGAQLSKMQKGVNIVKMNDGSVRKVINK